MDNLGYVPIFRKIKEWQWYTDPSTAYLFIHLLLSANHQPRTVYGIKVGVGQYLTGRKSLSRQTGLSEQQIRTSLRKLKSTNDIVTTATSKYTLITLVNYEKYRIDGKQQPGNQPSHQPTSNQQATTNNNINNINKKNKNIEPAKLAVDRSILSQKFKRTDYTEIVTYLNEKVNGDFKPFNGCTLKLLKELFKLGYTVKDIKSVIDIKVSQWINTDMSKFLVPKTLFHASKFESYIHESKQSKTLTNKSIYDDPKSKFYDPRRKFRDIK